MSKNHDPLQNKRSRNQLLMAASVMEFPSTTPKNVLVEKNIAAKLANYNFHKLMLLHIPLADVFQCFGLLVTDWIKNMHLSITDAGRVHH